MRPSLWLALCGLVLAQCAIHPPGPERFAFAVMGDTPYNPREEAKFVEMMAALDREPLAFVVHVGDITGGACSDALLARRFRQFDGSAHPFIYTPGDNEWLDCGPPHEALERLARIRAVFFAGDESLGRRRIATDVQRECVDGEGAACRCPIHRENRAWSRAGVRFVTLHYAGHDNNVGRSATGDAEARCRNEANRRWLARALEASRAPDVAALVVITQANPWFGRREAFDGFLRQLSSGAEALGKPMLLVHGDTHVYRVDRPFRDAFGDPRDAILRLETYGSPFVGWVRVEVDPSRPSPFSFDPRLAAVVLPR